MYTVFKIAVHFQTVVTFSFKNEFMLNKPSIKFIIENQTYFVFSNSLKAVVANLFCCGAVLCASSQVCTHLAGPLIDCFNI